MPSPVPDRGLYALMVQRLMDADLLLPDEGNALLTRIEAWSPPTDSEDAQRTHAERFIEALEAIVQTDRLDASAREAALKTARTLLHQHTVSTPPEAQSGRPRA
jgi:hypothetical protein